MVLLASVDWFVVSPFSLESVSWWLGWSNGTISAADGVGLIANWLAVSGDLWLACWELLLGKLRVFSAVWSISSIADWEGLGELVFSAVWTIGAVADWPGWVRKLDSRD